MKVNVLNLITDIEIMGDNMRTINMKLVEDSQCQSKYESEFYRLLDDCGLDKNDCKSELNIDINNLNYKETVELGFAYSLNITTLNVDDDCKEFYIVTKFENENIETIWCKTEEEANLKIKEFDIKVLRRINSSLGYEDFLKNTKSYSDAYFIVGDKHTRMDGIFYRPESYEVKNPIDVDGFKIVSEGNILTLAYDVNYDNYARYFRKIAKVVVCN